MSAREKLLEGLQIEIERAWNARCDHEIVDRLAAEHPDLAEELYEFFADVIEAGIGLDHPRPELAPADERIREWLEREGYRKVAEAYQKSIGQQVPK